MSKDKDKGKGSRRQLKGSWKIYANQLGFFMEKRSCQPSFHSQRRFHAWLLEVAEQM